MSEFSPEISFSAQYSSTTDILNVLNTVDKYYAQNIPPVNFSSGFQIQFPLFDLSRRAKAKGRLPTRCAPRSRSNRPAAK